jgi:outer membrane protein
MAAATAAETSFKAAQRLTEKRSESEKKDHSRNHVPRSSTDPMKSKFVRVLLAIAVTLTFSALAQTGSAATPSSAAAAPATTPAGSAPATTTGPTGATKVGTINIQEAIFGSNEGQKEIQALQKKFEPKQAELKSQNDELESLKKQLNTQGDKLNEDAAGNLKKQIETKQKSFDRNVQDAQEEFGSQQQDIASKILQKMAPMIVKYSQENGFGMIVDTSKPWPQSNVLWWGEAIDITKPVVEAYNVQSGVAAPTPPAGATAPKPTTPRAPTGTAPKSSTPKSSEHPK